MISESDANIPTESVSDSVLNEVDKSEEESFSFKDIGLLIFDDNNRRMQGSLHLKSDRVALLDDEIGVA